LTRWPDGKYVLLKPATGCPKGWKDKGWTFQDTIDGNNRSEILHIDGRVARNFVVRYFCIKTEQTDSRNWPQGKCTGKIENCAQLQVFYFFYMIQIRSFARAVGSYKARATANHIARNISVIL
jgi:hypothetical protein